MAATHRRMLWPADRADRGRVSFVMNHCRILRAMSLLAFSGVPLSARWLVVAHLNTAFQNPINDAGELKAVIGLLRGTVHVTLGPCRTFLNSAKA